MRLMLAVAAVLLVASGARSACRESVAAESARYTQIATKTLATCRRRHLPDCDADPTTAAKLALAAARLQAKIVAACCGADGACGTGDDTPLAAIGWLSGSCPNLDRHDCNNLVATPADVATCLVCIGRAAADDSTALAAPPPEPTLSRCTAKLPEARTDRMKITAT